MARKFMVAGVILLAAGCALIGRSALFILASRATEGTVVASVAVSTNQQAFRVRYAVDGRTYEVLTSTYDSGSNGPRIDETVTVRYPPGSPAEGRVYSIGEQLGPALFFLVPGLGLFLYGRFPEGATAGPLAKKRADA
jgi:hypothetical protein